MAGADGSGIEVTAQGLAAALAHATEMGKRFANLSPALKVIGAEMVKRTDDAFEQSRSPAGEPWPQLAESTRLGRKGARKLERRLNARDDDGNLTNRALNARIKNIRKSAIRYTTGDHAVVYAKPLVDTGRARSSQHTTVTAHLLTWSAVGYLAPHITGGKRGILGGSLFIGGRPPKRNPTVFEHGGAGGGLSIYAGTESGSGWRMNASMDDFARRTIVAYVQTGNPAVAP